MLRAATLLTRVYRIGLETSFEVSVRVNLQQAPRDGDRMA